MAQEKAPKQEGKGRKARRRGGDQAVLAVALWFVPMSLFLYIGFQIALATGSDPYAFVPAVSMWQVALGVALLIFGAVAIVSWRSRQSKAAEQANPARWDRYSTPF